MFALCATLAGCFVNRVAGRITPALFASVMFVAHPAMPYSLVAWITNQMHLIETLTVLTAFCWWSVVRSRSAIWWLPLLVLACVAFMIKEDGVMLLPSVIAIHAVYRRVAVTSLPPVPRTIVVPAVVLVAVSSESARSRWVNSVATDVRRCTRRGRTALAVWTKSCGSFQRIGPGSRWLTKDFEPFGPIVLANDRLVRGWTAVPANCTSTSSARRCLIRAASRRIRSTKSVT
jgi:hypothetical protein